MSESVRACKTRRLLRREPPSPPQYAHTRRTPRRVAGSRRSLLTDAGCADRHKIPPEQRNSLRGNLLQHVVQRGAALKRFVRQPLLQVADRSATHACICTRGQFRAASAPARARASVPSPRRPRCISCPLTRRGASLTALQVVAIMVKRGWFEEAAGMFTEFLGYVQRLLEDAGTRAVGALMLLSLLEVKRVHGREAGGLDMDTRPF